MTDLVGGAGCGIAAAVLSRSHPLAVEQKSGGTCLSFGVPRTPWDQMAGAAGAAAVSHPPAARSWI